jgi:antitoxin ParD1/3/4
MNIALPQTMKQFVQQQVARGGYSSVSEYVRDLIRSDQKEKARAALEVEVLNLEGAQQRRFHAHDRPRLAADSR